MAKSSDKMLATMLENVEDKTGKPLDAWLKLIAREKLVKHREILNHLKSEHGVTHGYANLIAAKALEAQDSGGGEEDLVAKQYGGGKADLRPIYDALVKAIGKFGKDVELSPKKAYVSLRRSKQFGLIQPSTKTRVDVGLNLKGVEPTERLEASGSFNAMVSHRVRLTSVDDVDKELLGWLKQAYEKS